MKLLWKSTRARRAKTIMINKMGKPVSYPISNLSIKLQQLYYCFRTTAVKNKLIDQERTQKQMQICMKTWYFREEIKVIK